jgi:DNA-binding NarL/FixJ family response regulator
MDSPAKTVRVILADDHTLVRAGIRALLERIDGVEVVAEASDGRETLSLVATHHPDAVLMDIAMPVLSGLEATAQVAREFPEVHVIILSMHANEEYVWQAIRAGASGYLLKKAATAELETALRQVMEGEIYLSPEIPIRLPDVPISEIADKKSPLEQLTPRQREILALIAESKNTKEIALTLKLSTKTVEYHRMQLMDRLKIHDIPGLVRYAIRMGVVPADS